MPTAHNDRLGSAAESLRESDLSRALTILRRRWPLVVLCAVLVPAAAYAVSKVATKNYSASSELFFRSTTPIDTSFLGGAQQSSPADTSQTQQATNVRLLSLGTLDDLTAAQLVKQGYSVDSKRVRRDVSIAPQGTSQIVEVTATTTDPKLSADMANAYAEQFIAFRRQVDSGTIVTAAQLANQLFQHLPPGERAGSSGRALQGRAQDLSLLASLQSGNAQQVQSAQRPTSPTSPRPVRNAVLGLLVGVVLGLALVVVAEQLDRRIREISEVERVVGRPVLGTVPKSRSLASSEIRPLRGIDAEAFQLLRASLQYFSLSQGRLKSVMIASPQPGDGKSTVALHLAMAAAVAGGRTLFIDGDLRRPSRFQTELGLSQILANLTSFEDAVIRVPVESVSDAAANGAVSMDVLASGPLPPNPVDLMNSLTMRELITRSEQQYDLVVFDAPPLTVVSDAIPVASRVSGLIVVARIGRTHRNALRRMVEQLELLHVSILGVVVNAVRRNDGYGYGYGYDRGYGQSREASVSVPELAARA